MLNNFTNERTKVWAQRIISSLLILYLVFFHVNLGELSVLVVDMNILWYVIAYTITLIGIFISVLRWSFVLSYSGEDLPQILLTKLYFVGIFYNITLPGSLTGDGVKAYKIAGENGDKGELAASVPIERTSGLIAMLLAMPFGIIFSPISRQLQVQITVILIFLLLFVVFLTSSPLQRIFQKITSVGVVKDSKVRSILSKIISSFQRFRDPYFFTVLMIYSIILFFASVGLIHTIGRAFGTVIPIPYLLVIFPITSIINMLPISVGGLGVRESLYVFFFSFINISSEIAVAVGVTYYSVQLLNGLIGGIIELKSSSVDS